MLYQPDTQRAALSLGTLSKACLLELLRYAYSDTELKEQVSNIKIYQSFLISKEKITRMQNLTVAQGYTNMRAT